MLQSMYYYQNRNIITILTLHTRVTSHTTHYTPEKEWRKQTPHSRDRSQ